MSDHRAHVVTLEFDNFEHLRTMRYHELLKFVKSFDLVLRHVGASSVTLRGNRRCLTKFLETICGGQGPTYDTYVARIVYYKRHVSYRAFMARHPHAGFKPPGDAP